MMLMMYIQVACKHIKMVLTLNVLIESKFYIFLKSKCSKLMDIVVINDMFSQILLFILSSLIKIL